MSTIEEITNASASLGRSRPRKSHHHRHHKIMNQENRPVTISGPQLYDSISKLNSKLKPKHRQNSGSRSRSRKMEIRKTILDNNNIVLERPKTCTNDIGCNLDFITNRLDSRTKEFNQSNISGPTAGNRGAESDPKNPTSETLRDHFYCPEWNLWTEAAKKYQTQKHSRKARSKQRTKSKNFQPPAAYSCSLGRGEYAGVGLGIAQSQGERQAERANSINSNFAAKLDSTVVEKQGIRIEFPNGGKGEIITAPPEETSKIEQNKESPLYSTLKELKNSLISVRAPHSTPTSTKIFGDGRTLQPTTLLTNVVKFAEQLYRIGATIANTIFSEPDFLREDTITYKGYRIRTWGKLLCINSLILRGSQMPKLRIVVQTSDYEGFISQNASNAALAGSEKLEKSISKSKSKSSSYKSQFKQKIFVCDEKWILMYGCYEEEGTGLVEIEAPSSEGISVKDIKAEGPCKGLIFIDVP